jgi:asparagine synthase (glutamine-hydrolysing)
VNAMRYLDFKLTLGAGILVKVDRASMAVSLETRPMFLNRAVLDLAGRIPPQALATGREPKIVLREALREWLPASVLDRKKMGFAMPLGRWLRDDPERLLGSPARSSPLSELVDPAYVSSVAKAHSLGGEDRTTELHNFAFLEHWLEKWW